MFGGSVGIDFLFGKVVGAAAGDAEGSPADPVDWRLGDIERKG